MKKMWIKSLLIMSLFVFSGIFLTACGARDSGVVKTSKSFYFKHINRPVTLRLSDVQKLSDAEKALSLRFARLDKELTSLERALDSVLDPTNQQTLASILNRFPWLSNIYVLSPDASILGAIPSTAPAAVDFAYLQNLNAEARDLYAHVISEPSPILLLARPYMKSDVLIGYLAVSFEPTSLLPFLGDSSTIYMATPEHVLWAGGNALSHTIDWQQELDIRSSGIIKHYDLGSNSNSLAWVVRYFAGLSLIFATFENFDFSE